ncbi:response regulator [Paraglaciecola aestuariivivens]
MKHLLTRLWQASLVFTLLVCCVFSSFVQANNQQSLAEQLALLKTQVQTNSPELAQQFEHFEQLFLQHPDDFHQSTFFNVQAYAYLLKLDLEAAYKKLLEARTKAQLSNNQIEVAESFRIEGAVLDTIGEYGDALTALNNGFQLYSELNSEKVLNIYNSLQNTYISLRDYQGMLDNAYQQLTAAQKFNNKESEGMAYFGIALAQINLGKLLDAEVNAALAESILQQANYPFIGNVHLLIAKLKVAKGEYDQALKRISQSIKADRKINFLHAEVPRLLVLAEIYQQQGDLQKAVTELETNLALEVLKKDKIQHLEILAKLIELTELTGDASAQLGYLKQYTQLYKQSFNQKQSQLVAINNVRLDVFEKEKAIKLLQKENELQSQRHLAQVQNNRYQVYFSLTLVAALLLVFFLFIRTRMQREQLNQYAQELKQATQAKSDFLARMSHEIRTPINAISGLTKLMQKNATNPEDLTNLRQIDQASHSLLGVINDILDFSKIEAGKLDIEIQPFQLDKIISQSLRLQSIRAHEKNIELIQHIARDVPLHLQGDGLRIQQVLVNLLSNAVKFTDEGLVSVKVKSQTREQDVVLEFNVTDTGIGLTEQEMSGLFESFAQVDESISRRFGGTGLGLAICKQLVELMGGNIWVESKPQQGSSFYFTVPVKVDKEQHIVSPSSQLSALKVLVADDVNLSRQVIADALLQVNIHCDLANGGQDTLHKLRSAVAQHAPYDLLLLDWKMPDIDGLQVTAIINQEFSRNKPKIIMLSAFDFAPMQQQAKELGIIHFIAKPFSASELINKMQETAFNITSPSSVSVAGLENVPDLTGKRILIAEDNKLNQKVALGFLKYTQAELHLVNNGLEVIEAVKKQPDFDCILMDLQMPEMDGLSATTNLRNELACTMPIVAMTANAMKQDMLKTAEVGMTAHITKPIDPEYLYQVLAEILLAKPANQSPQQALTQNQATLPPTAEQIDKLVILEQAKAMQKLFVNQQEFQALLHDFLDKENIIHTLENLIKTNDLDAVHKIIHDALPALNYIGAYNLAKLAKNIEDKLYTDKDSGSRELHQQLSLFNQAMLKLFTVVKQQLDKNE